MAGKPSKQRADRKEPAPPRPEEVEAHMEAILTIQSILSAVRMTWEDDPSSAARVGKILKKTEKRIRKQLRDPKKSSKEKTQKKSRKKASTKQETEKVLSFSSNVPAPPSVASTTI
jgi:hypothetical protein